MAAGNRREEARLRTRLRDLALANSRNRAILARLPDLGVADAWLVAGCVYDAVWNAHMGWPADAHVNDYDIFYFDGGDLSYAAEDAVIRRGRALFGDLGAPVEIRNQARVHLWYAARFGAPCAPIPSSAAAIGRFLIHSTCVGMRPTPGGDVAVHAPFGLADTFAGILRPNRRAGTAALAARKAAGYQARWPWLRYCPRAV